jgi:ligand-binding sensor domain-containing protein
MKNRIESIIATLVFLIMSIIASAQVAVGQWQDHFSYNYGKQLIVVDDVAYLISECGILKYDSNSEEIERLTRLNVLSDITPSGIAYDERTKSVIIGYSSGNIDFIRGNEIININDIKKKSINSSKSINSIIAHDGIAYLGCDFGIVCVNIERHEISETWFIGDNGSYVHVNDMDNHGDDLYVATTIGVFHGNINDNLVNFSNWQVLTDVDSSSQNIWMKGQNYNTLKWFNGKLLANYKSTTANSDSIMAYDGNSWTHVMDSCKSVASLSCNDEMILCSSGGPIYAYNSDLEMIDLLQHYKRQYEWRLIYANNTAIVGDKIWIADGLKGLGWLLNIEGSGDVLEISSPSNNNVFQVASAKSKVIAVRGGYKSSYTPTWTVPTLYEYENYEWRTRTSSEIPELTGINDLVNVTIDPNDESHFFVSSWMKGLVEFRGNQFYKLYNSENSSLMQIDGIDWERIGTTVFDKDGNLWVTNSLAAKCIHRMAPDGKWTGYSFSDMTRNIKSLLVTSTGIKWLVLGQSGGLFVFDDNGTPENTTDDKYKFLSVMNEEGEVVSNDVYSIAEDKNGYVWVGTAKGVVVYYNPDKVFDNSVVRGRQIKVPRNDGTDNADLLLAAEVVTAIVVDGANCKWFGTQNGGAYYTSADGIETIHHFNTQNSPIPSDNILSITVVPETGEVFFATSKGIVSFRGSATEGTDDYEEIYAFPNPVKSNYEGPITIKGLVAGSIVKIADIAGNIVFEARSTGGQIVWDGKNLNGNKIASGVYVVFASTEIGDKKSTTKILFLK